MRRFFAVLAGSCLVVALGMAGCRNDAPTEVPAVTGTSLKVGSLRSDSLALMRTVAHGLALALADPEVRAGLRTAFRRSTVREGKLHLQRFLQARGSDLGRAIGRQSSFGEAGWTRGVSQLPDLEIYMPIPAQRSGWSGTSDILVAGFLETDEEIRKAGGTVTAYRTDGSSVQIAYDAVPDQPVIAIYPVETSFGTDGESPEATALAAASGNGGGVDGVINPALLIFPPGPTPVPSACSSNNPSGANLYVCHSSIPNPGQYEEFLRGGPEFAMAMFSVVPPPPGYLVDPATRRLVACINEDQTGSKFYNQDSDNWDGKALLLSRTALQAEQNAGRRVMMIVWEDDNGSKCDFNPEGNQVAPWATIYGLSFVSGFAGVASGGLGGWALASISAIVNGVTWLFATSGDDIVGGVMIPSTSDPLTNPKEIRRESNVISGKVTFMTY
jgi:hypothetical protein